MEQLDSRAQDRGCEEAKSWGGGSGFKGDASGRKEGRREERLWSLAGLTSASGRQYMGSGTCVWLGHNRELCVYYLYRRPRIGVSRVFYIPYPSLTPFPVVSDVPLGNQADHVRS